MADVSTLVAHCEPAWSDAGLGSPAVHIQVTGLDVATLTAQIGFHLCVTVAPDLLRLEPSIDLELLAALLRTHGWAISRNGELLIATQAKGSRHAASSGSAPKRPELGELAEERPQG